MGPGGEGAAVRRDAAARILSLPDTSPYGPEEPSMAKRVDWYYHRKG